MANIAYNPAEDPMMATISDPEYPPDTGTLSTMGNSLESFTSSDSVATRRILETIDYHALFN